MKRLVLTAGLSVALFGVASMLTGPSAAPGATEKNAGSRNLSVNSNEMRKAKAPRKVNSTDPLLITPNDTSGIYGANYTFTDPNTGEVYGFMVNAEVQEDYWEGKKTFNVYGSSIVGVKTYKSYANLPSRVKIEIPAECEGSKDENGEPAYRVLELNNATFHHDLVNAGLQTSFQQFTAEEFGEIKKNYDSEATLSTLTDIYLPEDITSIQWTGKFDTKAHNFHLSSQTPPGLYCDEYSKGKIILYVDDDLLDTYREYVKSNYSDYTLVVRSNTPLSPTYVNVEEPGTLAEELSKIAPNLQEVKWVIVTGKPNSEDLRFFRRLPNLEVLDLSETTGLKEVSGCNELEYLRVVKLPETGTITTIGTKAFQNCVALDSINIPAGVTSIGEYAFNNTRSLDSIQLPGSLKVIDQYAFRESRIRKINLDSVTQIRSYSFKSCQLDTINLNSIKNIGYEAFSSNNNLREVKFGDSLSYIDGYAFEYCDLRRLKLPNSNYRLSNYVFTDNSNLKYVEFSSNNNIQMYENAIGYRVNPDTIVVKYLFPLEKSGFYDESLRNAKVFVPALTYNDYLLSDAWAACPNIVPMEEDLEELTVDRPFNLRSEKGLAEKAKVEITGKKLDDWEERYSYGSLTVKRKTDLNTGLFKMSGDFGDGYYYDEYGNYREYTGYNGCTFLPKSTVTAEDVTLHVSLQRGRWHFISLPFDVKVKDIEVEDEALWVVRHYSGENRAAMNGETWENLKEDDVLKAGEGYIFHCDKEGKENIDFTFRRTDGDDLFFEFNKVETALKSYPSEFAHNAHWNLVGNPYPAYLSLKAIEFDAPITVWNGSTYMAYSTIDDELALDPFQAFFVQLQEIEGGDVLTLDAWGRGVTAAEALAAEPAETETASKARAMARTSIKENRSLFNLMISDGTHSDRTRLVVNEDASTGYESNRDASKFMSTNPNVPQVFIMNDRSRMAIDERPLGEGVYNIGFYAPKKGEYSFSLAGSGLEDYTAFLIDNLKGTETEITDSDYIFTADAGINEGRFMLKLRRGGVETGIEESAVAGTVISTEGNVLNITAPVEVEITVVAADGKVYASATSASFTATLPEGVYAVKAGEVIRKIIIR
ncbi:MAG: leucine-rich repeat domain-containing protein [Muribaculaceae bacterium]|nr:leucine-rich repeat domain-containing protein [Muribaculaceae bacterium]